MCASLPEVPLSISSSREGSGDASVPTRLEIALFFAVAGVILLVVVFW